MAYDEGLAQIMRADLGAPEVLVEKRMFGGLCFMRKGHMICGLHQGGGLYRVGKAARAEALALPRVRPIIMGGRSMGGYVELPAEAMGDATTRRALLDMASAFTATLPPK